MGYWGVHSNQGDGPFDALAALKDGQPVAELLKEDGRDGVGAVLQHLLDGGHLSPDDIRATIALAESFEFGKDDTSQRAAAANLKEIAFFKSCLETGRMPPGTSFHTPGLFETMSNLLE